MILKYIKSTLLASIMFVLLISCEYKASDESNADILSYLDFDNNTVDLISSLKLAKIKKVISFESSSSVPSFKASDLYSLSRHSVFIYASGSRSIARFDTKGAYIDTIGAYGKGPGEYISPKQLYSDGEKLYVLDNMVKKIHSYDIANDQQFPSANFRSPAYEFFSDGNDFIFYTPYKTSQSLFTELSDEMEVDIAIDKPTCYDVIDFDIGKKIYAFKNSINFLDCLSGFVYTRPISGDDAPLLKYEILLEDQFSLNKCSSRIFDEPSELSYRFPTEFIETEKHFVIKILDKGFQTNTIINDKGSKNFVVGDDSLMESSFLNILPFFPSYYHQNGEFSAMVDYDYLYNICGFSQDRLPSELKSMSEGDNPLLIIYELTSF